VGRVEEDADVDMDDSASMLVDLTNLDFEMLGTLPAVLAAALCRAAQERRRTLAPYAGFENKI